MSARQSSTQPWNPNHKKKSDPTLTEAEPVVSIVADTPGLVRPAR
jgi:hypothetical protein